MAVLRLFASAREAAGTGRVEIPATTVGDALAAAVDRFGPEFETLLGSCRIWVNGEPCEPTDPLGDVDEIAVLPPVSGGALA